MTIESHRETTNSTLYLTPNGLKHQVNLEEEYDWTFAGTVFSTTDLVAGSSALPSNQLYFVYE